jgi:hypothetical protein
VVSGSFFLLHFYTINFKIHFMNRKKIISMLAAAAIVVFTSAAQPLPYHINPVAYTGKASQIISIDDTDGLITKFNYTPKATLHNNEAASQSFTLCFETSHGYKSTRRVTLSENASATVLFDELLLPAGNQTFTVKLYTDGNPNDALETLTKSVSVSTDSLSLK